MSSNPDFLPDGYKCSPNTCDWVVTESDRLAVEEGCYFDVDAAIYVFRFFVMFVKHIDGPDAGQPFIPLKWQWERIIAPAFGWKMPDKFRRFREVEIWIPKKNGKTTLMAGLVMYMLIADKEVGARVYSAGADRKQAALVFEATKSMVKHSKAIATLLVVKKSSRRVDCPLLDSYYEVLSADAFRNEGHNIHALFFDELHTQKNRLLWGTLRYGSAARKQVIRFVLSTVGVLDETTLWWERFNYALAIQEGRKTDIHLLPCVYAMKQKEDWKDKEVWKRVNPSWNDTVNPLEFERDFKSAQHNPASESEFKRYRLNMPTRSLTGWIPYHFWEKCMVERDIKPAKKRLFIGVDLADSTDLVAVVAVWEEDHPTKQSVVCVEAYFWAPEEAGITSNEANRERYESYWESGHLSQTPGNIIPINYVEPRILELFEDNFIVKVGVDKFNAKRFVTGMNHCINERELDLEVDLISYNGSHMNEPTRFLGELIVSGRLMITNNPVMDWMFGNLRAMIDSSGNIKLDKRNSLNKIDGFAALTIALACFISAEPEFRSRYETQGLSTMEIMF